MASLLCHLLLSCALAAPGARSIDDLTYGRVLYDYYLQDDQQALVDVMVAERQGRTGDDPVRFELAKGSFAFQQGMYRFATATFGALARDELTDVDRRRLAFHLAREYYRRGDWPDMETQLSRLDEATARSARRTGYPEVTFMRAEAAVARQDYATAEATLAEIPDDDVFRAYGLFNLGVAYRRGGDAAAARQAFSRLASLTGGGGERRDLIQRGRLALALMAGQSGDALSAESLLGSLPAQGRYRDQALAAYGRLAMERGQPELAARIWLTLQKQPGWSSGHALAELALPMSLEKLASPAHALDRYREAEQVFERRLAVLNEASVRAGDPVWIDRLLDAFAEPDEKARTRALARLDHVLDQSEWLEWLAGEDAHRAMTEWRDLTGMAGWLSQLPDDIAAYEEVTAERRRRSAQAHALLTRQALPGRRDALAAQVASQERDLAALAAAPAQPDTGWMRRLASDRERKVIDQLESMSRRAKAMPAQDRDRFLVRVRRLQGVVFWQIADHKAARVRALQKRLNESKAVLADVDERIARLATAERRFATGVETDFLALEERADGMSRRVAAALDTRRRTIARLLQRGLDQEMARTRDYLLTTRVAIARASDQLAGNAGSRVEGGQ